MVKMNGGGRANSVGRSVGQRRRNTDGARFHATSALFRRRAGVAPRGYDHRPSQTDGRRIVARPLGIRGKGVMLGGCGALEGG